MLYIDGHVVTCLRCSDLTIFPQKAVCRRTGSIYNASEPRLPDCPLYDGGLTEDEKRMLTASHTFLTKEGD